MLYTKKVVLCNFIKYNIFGLRNYNNLTLNLRRNLFFCILIIYLSLQKKDFKTSFEFIFPIKSFFFLHFRHCNDIWTTHHPQTIRGPLNISDDEAPSRAILCASSIYELLSFFSHVSSTSRFNMRKRNSYWLISSKRSVKSCSYRSRFIKITINSVSTTSK